MEEFAGKDEVSIGQSSVKGADYEIAVVVEGKQKDIFMLNGTPNIVADVGKEYKVKFWNHSDEEVLCGLTIDGVEVLGGSMMIIGANDHYSFTGFRQSEGLAAFMFSPLKQSQTSQSYSSNKSYNDVPDFNVGLITCSVWKCKRLGMREDVGFGYSSSTHVDKGLNGIKADKKKCAVATGTGAVTKSAPNPSKYRYETGPLVQTLEIRYNGIGVKIPTAELDAAIDYE